MPKLGNEAHAKSIYYGAFMAAKFTMMRLSTYFNLVSMLKAPQKQLYFQIWWTHGFIVFSKLLGFIILTASNPVKLLSTKAVPYLVKTKVKYMQKEVLSYIVWVKDFAASKSELNCLWTLLKTSFFTFEWISQTMDL